MRTALPSLASFAASLVLASMPAALAQKAQIEADVNASPFGNVYPERQIVELGGWWYFARDVPGLGIELWRTAGPAGPLELVRDISPGPAGGRPDLLTVYQGALYFAADDGVHGFELWRSDGTAAGTSMVVDLHTGIAHGFEPQVWLRDSLVVTDGHLWFGAKSSTNGLRLYRSDGTAAGTQIVTTSTFAVPSYSPKFVGLGSSVYYAGYGGLWKSSVGSTTSLGSFYSGGNALTVLANEVYFHAAGTWEQGYELWKTDGTSAGTQLVKDIYAGLTVSQSSYPSLMTVLGNEVLFTANDGAHGRELWASDGTPAGTRLVLDIWPGPDNAVGDNIYWRMASFAGRVWFAADDGNGATLWSSDGTAAGTTPLLGSSGPFVNFLGDLPQGNVAGTRMYFTATGAGGTELWVTDGSSGSTHEVAGLAPGPESSFPTGIVSDGANGAYFLARVGGATALYHTDGTAAGTSLVADRAASTFPLSGNSTPQGLLDHAGQLFFAAWEATHGNELWVSDGDGVELLGDWNPGPWHSIQTTDPEYLAPAPLVAVTMGRHLYTIVHRPGGMELLRSDGSPAGTVSLHSFDTTGLSAGFNFYGAVIGSSFVFSAYTAGQGWGLWRSDGTSAGTVLLFATPNAPLGFVRAGNRAYFFTYASVFPTVPALLWRTDGRAAGTEVVATFSGGKIFDVSSLATLGDRLVFAVDDVATGKEPWVSDGTSAGTVPLGDLAPGADDSNPSEFLRFRDRVYFAASGGQPGRELWSTDGTPGGTALAADVWPGAGSGNPTQLTTHGTRLLFVGSTQQGVRIHGFDGANLTSSNALPGAPDVEDLAAAGSRRAYFGAYAGDDAGRELWVSDGLPGGTQLVEDYLVGFWADPAEPTLSHGELHLVQWDFLKGIELFRMHIGATAQPIGVGCAGTGRLPELAATDPVLGGTTTFGLVGAGPGLAVVLLAGAPTAPVELGGGCTAYLVDSSAIVLGAASTDGAGEWTGAPQNIPASPALAGLALVAQAVLGPTATAPLGLDLSNGVRLTLGE